MVLVLIPALTHVNPSCCAVVCTLCALMSSFFRVHFCACLGTETSCHLGAHLERQTCTKLTEMSCAILSDLQNLVIMKQLPTPFASRMRGMQPVCKYHWTQRANISASRTPKPDQINRAAVWQSQCSKLVQSLLHVNHVSRAHLVEMCPGAVAQSVKPKCCVEQVNVFALSVVHGDVMCESPRLPFARC